MVSGLEDMLFEVKSANRSTTLSQAPRGIEKVEGTISSSPKEIPDLIAEEAVRLWNNRIASLRRFSPVTSDRDCNRLRRIRTHRALRGCRVAQARVDAHPLRSRSSQAQRIATFPGEPIRAATVEDSASLDRALAGSAAVINCAGPFAVTAVPVIQAALRARIPYLDVAAK